MAIREYTINGKVDASKLSNSVETVLSKKTYTIKVDAKGSTQKLTTEMEKTSSGAGQLTTTVKKLNETTGAMSTTITNSSKAVKGLGTDFVETLGKVAKFGAVTAIIGLFTSAIGEAISTTKEFDSSLVELRKVSDLGGDSLKQYTKDAFDLGKQLHTTASNVTDAVTEFSKSGYTIADSEQLAKQAIMFQGIADSEISSADAATTLIQVMKAYNMTATDSEHIINSINEVSNSYALSSTDLSNSIGKVASTAQTAGVSYENLLGLMTAGTEVTQNASKTANGLKSILVNLMSDKLSAQFSKFGISMRNTNGEMKNGYDILQELSVAYKNLMSRTNDTSEETVKLKDDMNALLTNIGGKYNINVLTAELSNFGQAINATDTAINSAGSAQEEYTKSLDSISKKIESLKGAFQEFVYGDGGLSSFIKLILDAVTTILKFANSDVGGAIIKISALAVGIILLSKGFDALKKSMVLTSLDHFVAWAGVATSGVEGLKIAFDQLKGSILTNPLFIGGIVIAGIAKFIKYCKENADSVENLTKKVNELKEETKSLQSEYDTLSSKQDLTKSEERRLELLKAQIEANKILIQQEAQKAYETQYAEQSGATDVSKASYGGRRVHVDSGEEELTEIDKSIQKYNELNETKSKSVEQDDEIIAKKSELVQSLSEEAERLETAKNNGADIYEDDEERLEQIYDIIDAYNKEAKATNNSTNATEDSTDAMDENEDSADDTATALENLAKSVGLSTDELKAQSESAGMSVQAYADMKNGMDSFNDSIDGIQSAYGTLKSAVDEYNASGEMSLDTLQALLALDPEYLSMLQEDGNQLSINEVAIRNKVIAQAEEAKQTIYNTAIAKLNALANQTAGKNAITAGNNASSSASGFITQADGINTANSALLAHLAMQRALDSKANRLDVKQVWTDMNAQIKLVNKSVASLDTSFENTLGKTATKTANKASKASNGVSKAVDKTNKKLERQEKILERLQKKLDKLNDKKDDFEDAIDYITSAFESQIDKIENKLDKLDEEYEKHKDVINDSYDFEQDKINEKIDSLKSEKDALEDFYDKQLDSLKETNDTLNEQITLQEKLEALAKAKSKQIKVFKGGQFVYAQDEEAVSSAQKDVNATIRQQQYNAQVKALEKAKEQISSIYDALILEQEGYLTFSELARQKELAELEKDYNAKVTQYEKEKQLLEQRQKNFENQIDQEETNRKRLLAQQLMGTKGLQRGWETRLENLRVFVKQWNDLLGQLQAAQAAVSAQQNVVSNTKSGSTTVKKKASGSASLESDGLTVVGENPNKEIVIGSKLNNGVLMNLEKGTGVVNAKSTQTLAGLLNTLGSSNVVNQPTISNSSSKSVTQQFSFGNISLPNVTNANEFVQEIKNNYKNFAIQESY